MHLQVLFTIHVQAHTHVGLIPRLEEYSLPREFWFRTTFFMYMYMYIHAIVLSYCASDESNNVIMCIHVHVHAYACSYRFE